MRKGWRQELEEKEGGRTELLDEEGVKARVRKVGRVEGEGWSTVGEWRKDFQDEEGGINARVVRAGKGRRMDWKRSWRMKGRCRRGWWGWTKMLKEDKGDKGMRWERRKRRTGKRGSRKRSWEWRDELEEEEGRSWKRSKGVKIRSREEEGRWRKDWKRS